MLTNDCLLQNHISTLISLWRNNKNANFLSKPEILKVSSDLLSLQRGLTGKRELVGSGYMENPSQLGAYLLYYWPISYMQIYWAAKSCPELIAAEKKEINILDMGSGPAPASVSLCDLLLKNGVQKISVDLCDFSQKALNLASQIYSRDLKSVTIKTRVQNFEKEPPHSDKKYDIIIMSHALNELWKNSPDFIQKRTDFLIKLSENLVDDGILFLSEPALLETSRNLLQIRNRLIQNGFCILSPCPGQSDCPALSAGPNHTCHAEISLAPVEPVSSIAKNARLDRESVKMTYFIFKKGYKTVPMEEDFTAIKGKVVSDAMLNKSGRIRFLICDGKTRTAVSAKKDDQYAKKIKFFALKRYDSILISNPEIRGDNETKAYGIKEDTELRVQKFLQNH